MTRKMTIEITNEEALVLFEWLCTNSKQTKFYHDKSEQYVFWNIECQLERMLPEPHSDSYLTALSIARDTVMRKYGGDNCACNSFGGN